VVRYLTSRKHLAGTASGVVGVGLAFAGLTGPLWPLVVLGLYGAGALAAPSDPPTMDVVRQMLANAATEAAALRHDLDRIGSRVHAAASAGQLPPGSLDRFEDVEHKLAEMLAHPHALADADVLHVLSTTIRKDLDQIVGGYLALPAHLRARMLPDGERTADQELVHQLQLLDDYLTVTSDRLFQSQTQDIVDLSDYLESRTPRPDELDLTTPTPPPPPALDP
jgi:hypothetical protein